MEAWMQTVYLQACCFQMSSLRFYDFQNCFELDLWLLIFRPGDALVELWWAGKEKQYFCLAISVCSRQTHRIRNWFWTLWLSIPSWPRSRNANSGRADNVIILFQPGICFCVGAELRQTEIVYDTFVEIQFSGPTQKNMYRLGPATKSCVLTCSLWYVGAKLAKTLKANWTECLVCHLSGQTGKY